MSIYRRIEVLTRLASALSSATGDPKAILVALANGLRDYMGCPVESWVIAERNADEGDDEPGSARLNINMSVDGRVLRVEFSVTLHNKDKASIEIAERNWNIALSHAGSLQQVYEEASDKLQHLFTEAAWG